jgi:hypothetical protein
MQVTVPLGMRRRLSIGHSRRAGWWIMRLRKASPRDWDHLAWDDGEDPPPDAGVREPRNPPLSPREGTAALPEPD